MAIKRYELTEEQWERVKDLIHRSKMGRPPKDNRLMVNGMLWMARSGAGWEDLPERYGPWKTVYSRFCKWRPDGTFLRIFQAVGEDSDMETLSLDSTSVKAHQHSAGAKKGQ
jgi:transposase